MKLDVLTLDQCQQVRIWRNASISALRTSIMLTKEMQNDFYNNVICNRESNHRYWSIIEKPEYGKNFIGMGGITYIQWESRIGEITLIIDPEKRNCGYGERAVDLLLDQAFNHLNLQTVFGECYECNSAVIFWRKITEKYSTLLALLPKRKYWKGEYFNSLYFSIDKNDFNNHNKQGQ